MKKTKHTKTNLNALDDFKNQDIDYSDIPELDDEFFKSAKIVEPKSKHSLTVRYDDEVIQYFKKTVGKGYQSKMNTVLRAYVLHEKLANPSRL